MSDFKMSDTIITKSDQINGEDLLLSNRVIKITGHKFTPTKKDQPLTIYYEGDNGRPFKPCLTMRKALQYAYGEDPDNLIGKHLELYCDHDVKFGGEKVGGVRIAGMSDLPAPILKASFTETRGRKKEYNFKRIEKRELPLYPEDKFNEAFPVMEGKIKSEEMTNEQVINQCEKSGRLSDDQKSRIRDVQIDSEPEYFND